MYSELKNGWEPPISVTVDEYKNLMQAPPSALRGFAGFGCSFGGKWFGGYARKSKGDDTGYAKQSRNVLLKQASYFKNIEFNCSPYQDISPVQGDVVYLDPPYQSTTGYKGTPTFLHEVFWDTVRWWRESGVDVYISEFMAPPDFKVMWEKERKVGIDSQDGGCTLQK